jgi:radical SAM protein with 4Fe4S-binding SPASM domain
MSKNVTDYKNIISLAHDLGVPFVRFIPLRQVGSACASWSKISCGLLQDECEEFFDYVNQHAREEFPGMKITSGISGFVLDPKKFDKRGHWCSIGNELAVDTNGDIFPCVIMMQKEFCLGNIRTTTVNDLKKSPVLAKLVTALSERKDHNSKCQECMWKNFCQCGCMALAMDRFGSIWEPDEFCVYRKKLYDEALIKIAQGKTSANIMGGGTECT